MLTEALDWLGFGASGQKPGSHGHSHSGGDHGHTHGVVDATIVTTSRGIWAIKWSFVVLAITAADAARRRNRIRQRGAPCRHDPQRRGRDTAIPLWVAFRLVGGDRPRHSPSVTARSRISPASYRPDHSRSARWWPAMRPSTACSIPNRSRMLGWVAVAGLVGFVGNEAVAVLRIRVGRQINSAR